MFSKCLLDLSTDYRVLGSSSPFSSPQRQALSSLFTPPLSASSSPLVSFHRPLLHRHSDHSCPVPIMICYSSVNKYAFISQTMTRGSSIWMETLKLGCFFNKALINERPKPKTRIFVIKQNNAHCTATINSHGFLFTCT